MSSTAKSSVALQKAAGKRAAEDIGDLNNTNKKMKGNRGRPWMDDSEGRVIHTAGKTQLPRRKDQEMLFSLPNKNQDGCFRVG